MKLQNQMVHQQIYILRIKHLTALLQAMIHHLTGLKNLHLIFLMKIYLHIKNQMGSVLHPDAQMEIQILFRAGAITKLNTTPAAEMGIQKIVILKQILQKMLLLKMDF